MLLGTLFTSKPIKPTYRGTLGLLLFILLRESRRTPPFALLPPAVTQFVPLSTSWLTLPKLHRLPHFSRACPLLHFWGTHLPSWPPPPSRPSFQLLPRYSLAPDLLLLPAPCLLQLLHQQLDGNTIFLLLGMEGRRVPFQLKDPAVEL